MVFPLGTRNTGQRAGERRAVYQECPLQASVGGTTAEEGSTAGVGLSGEAWDECNEEAKEDPASVY